MTDLVRSVAFYEALLAPLGQVQVWASERGAGFGRPKGPDRLALFAHAETGPAGPGFHLAFQAPSTSAVDEAYRAALAGGGLDEGPPGLRPQYGAGYYAAFVRDPDGHKLEVKHQVAGPHREVRRGEVYWLQTAPPGGVLGKPHPYVVVQDDVLNRSRLGTVVLCGMSTNPARYSEPGNVVLDAGEGGLSRVSTVVVSQVVCVPRSQLGDRIGTVGADRVDQVLAGLAFQQRSGFVR